MPLIFLSTLVSLPFATDNTEALLPAAAVPVASVSLPTLHKIFKRVFKPQAIQLFSTALFLVGFVDNPRKIQ